MADVLLLGALGVLSCATPRNYLATAPALDLRPAPGSPEEVVQRAASLSIHAYVEQHRAPLRELLRNVTTMSPVAAAQVLARDESWHSPFRRRLATVRLVAHARDEPEAMAAVDVLLGSADLRARLLAWIDAHSGVHAAASGENPEAIVAEGLQAVVAGVPGPLALVGACTSWSPASNVTKPNGYNVKISMRAEAGRPFDEAKPKVDPRNWHACAPNFWAKTYLVKVVNGKVQFDRDGLPVPSTDAPSEGDDLVGQVLYEDVTCDGKCALSLLLHVSAANSSAPQSYLLSFDQPEQLSGSPSLIGDDGDVRVTDNAGTLEVESIKNLGFKYPADASAIYVLLKSIAVTEYLAQVVCCN